MTYATLRRSAWKGKLRREEMTDCMNKPTPKSRKPQPRPHRQAGRTARRQLWSAAPILLLTLVSATGCGTTPSASPAGTPGQPLGTTTSPAPSAGGGPATRAGTASSHSSAATAAARWLTMHRSARTVDVRLWAGTHHHFNFNGYSNGFMTITVPLGWRVRVHFVNKESGFLHSAMIVPFAQVTANDALSPAFPGAFTPHPASGTPANVPQTFAFSASRAGKYAIVCAVPGYIQSGMWDVLIVSRTAAAPSIAVK